MIMALLVTNTCEAFLPGQLTPPFTKETKFNQQQEQYCQQQQSFYHKVLKIKSVWSRQSLQLWHTQTSDKNEGNNKNGTGGLSSSNNLKIPKHVAFICDGNSRWATQRGLPASAGHAAGADQLVKILDALRESKGVQYCTLFAFSTENWNRPSHEIQDLLSIMEECCHKFYPRILREPMQIKVLGDLADDRIPESLQSALRKLERDSHASCAQLNEDDKFTVCFALNYGGRRDILNASLQLAQYVQEHQLNPNDVTEDMLSNYLSTGLAGIPDPDLVIRTSGECRLSNFLLWNAAYSELYFTPVLWPDFNRDCWLEALEWYSQRQRKFGGRTTGENSAASTKMTASTTTITTTPTHVEAVVRNQQTEPPVTNGAAEFTKDHVEQRQ